jgi:hypothetical protein
MTGVVFMQTSLSESHESKFASFNLNLLTLSANQTKKTSYMLLEIRNLS